MRYIEGQSVTFLQTPHSSSIADEMDSQEEEHLVAAARHARDRFAPLYEAYHADVFRFILRRVCRMELAADLTQQTFLKAMLGIDGYVSRGIPFRAWLYRIALNEVRMYWRKRKEVLIELDPGEVASMCEELGLREEDERLEALLQALGNLKDPQARLIELRFMDGLSFAEVGQVLGIGEDAAKMRTHRVLASLRTQLSLRS